MKIITILGLILLGIIITAGGVPGTDPIGFRFWRNPGPFQQENGIPGSKGRFLSFWTGESSRVVVVAVLASSRLSSRGVVAAVLASLRY
jgi:amino acid permease